MNLIISFSGRKNGNCDNIAGMISKKEDKIIHFRDLNIHPCYGCNYECFRGECPYRDDGLYELYVQMGNYEKVILIVPMYCGNPSALYFIFSERCQDYFMHNDTYEEIVKRLYIIGIYGNSETTPNFIPCFEQWFHGSPYQNHVLGIERHLYSQNLSDSILDVEDVVIKIRDFLQ